MSIINFRTRLQNYSLFCQFYRLYREGLFFC